MMSVLLEAPIGRKARSAVILRLRLQRVSDHWLVAAVIEIPTREWEMEEHQEVFHFDRVDACNIEG